MAISKSVYYGYTLRMPNSPQQQWVLSQLPVPVTAMFTSSSTDEVAAEGIIPITGCSFNEVGGKINTDGTFSIPAGMYRIKFQTLVGTSEATVGIVSISLNAGTTTVLESAATVQGDAVTVQGEILLSCSGCNVKWSLVNTSENAVTPTSMGLYTAQVIIERIL